MPLLEDDVTDSQWFLLVEGTWVVGIALYLETFSLPYFSILMVYVLDRDW
jgi:hypothetical protein